MLTAISPVDGRYATKTKALQPYYSEFALIRYRLQVELEYFEALYRLPLPQLAELPVAQLAKVRNRLASFSERDAQAVKDIERTTNHDVKAVEYFLKEIFEANGLGKWKEFIHFGLTSQDINNTSIPWLHRDAMEEVFYPKLDELCTTLDALGGTWSAVPMLARTHGQPASPTRLGKEIRVFHHRLTAQQELLKSIPHRAKFGGATGNFNAHYVAYPSTDWHSFATTFIQTQLKLERTHPSTQIEPYDHLAAQCHGLARINTILIDLCRDIWTYISMDYFKQRVIAGEVGSSAMPHKVNPIDFENAEGNLGIANALLEHLAGKLPISRLQRDLTDSTVLRNLGVPIAHSYIALGSILKGLSKLVLNEAKLNADLEDNWMVVSEAIQTILRREGYPQPYEKLKALTRGAAAIDGAAIARFIDTLEVSDAIKTELKAIRPDNYLGV